jgi:hypothetical protein
MQKICKNRKKMQKTRKNGKIAQKLMQKTNKNCSQIVENGADQEDLGGVGENPVYEIP